MLCKLDTFATDQTTFCRVLSSCLFDRGIAKFRSFVRRFDARMISEIGILLLAFQSLVILNCDGLGCMSWMKSLLLCLFSRDTTSFWTSSNWSLNQYGYIFPARSSSCTGEFSTQEWSAKFLNLFLLRSHAHTQARALADGLSEKEVRTWHELILLEAHHENPIPTWTWSKSRPQADILARHVRNVCVWCECGIWLLIRNEKIIRRSFELIANIPKYFLALVTICINSCTMCFCNYGLTLRIP